MEHVEIEIVKNIERFKELKEDWNNLLEQSNSKSIFLTWEWLYYWWIHFGERKELFIILIKDKTVNKVLAIAPLCIEKIKLFNFVPIKKLKFLGTEKVCSDFLDFIILPGLEDKVFSYILEYFNKNNRAWDVVEINDIEEDSISVTSLKNIVNGNYKILETEAHACPYLDLPANYELLLQCLSTKMRSNLKYQTKQLENKFKISYLVNCSQDRIEEKIDTLFLLHNERFRTRNGKSSKSSFSGDKIKKFHCDVALNFLLNGWLRLCFLNYNGESIASLYTFKYKDRLFYYQSGINYRWSRWSPGTVLLGYSIRDSIKEGLKEFHYLRGNEEYKAKWTKKSKNTNNIIIIKKNFIGNIYALLIQMKIFFKKLKMFNFRIK